MRTTKVAFGALIALATGMSACSCEPAEPPLPQERVDSGFRVDQHAFQFPNFGGVDRHSRMNEELLVRLHGKDAICADDAANCRLKPIAKEYMKAVNTAMRGGRCEGFALLSGLIFTGEIPSDDFGAALAGEMALDDNEPLAREIAYWFATQYLRDVVTDSTTAMGGEAAVRFLTSEFSKEEPKLYRLGIARLDEQGRLTGGHAILPIAVGPGEGEGKFIIWAYDNNHPDSEREIHVDANTGEWSYHAATNPDEEGALYVGNAENGNMLYLAELSARLGRHECSFCSDEDGEAAMQQVFGSAGVEIAAADEGGQQTGERDGKILTEIPGSAAAPVFSADLWTDDTGVQSFIPKNGSVKLSIRPSGTSEQSGEQNVVLLADGTIVSVSGFSLEDGQEGSVTVDVEQGTLTYEAPEGGGGGGSVTFGTTSADGTQTVVSLQLPSEGTSSASITVDPTTGNPSIEVSSESGEDVTVSVTVSNDSGEVTFTGSIPVPPGGSTTLLVDQWEGEGDDLGAEVDEDGDGTPDNSVSLPDAGEEALPPAAPSDLRVASSTDTSATIQWTDNATTEASFEIQRDSGAGFVTRATVAANTVSYTDTGLAPASLYRYRVRATNLYGASTFSNIVNQSTPACNPGTQLVGGACVACTAGQYCPGGVSPAQACVAGTVDSDNNPATACSGCAIGTYCSGGVNAPVSCAAGTSDHDRNAATQCVACTAGQTCPGGATAATQCPAGTRDHDNNPATACQGCAEGQYCAGGNTAAVTCAAGTADHDNSPATACVACTAGQYCPGGAVDAAVCPAGTRDHDNNPATACQACVEGQYCAGGNTAAVTCAAGTADHDNSPTTACQACTAGSYCAGGAVDAAVCAAGTIDNDTNPATACTACAVGEYCAGGGTVATACAAGTWDHDASPATACVACVEGEYCAGGATAPEVCAAAFHDDDNDPATACVFCAEGLYCAGGAADAVVCLAGEVDDDNDSATPCLPCNPGEYCAGGAADAVVCPAGTVDDDLDPQTDCVACNPGEYCAGAADPAFICSGNEYDDDADPATVCALCPNGGASSVDGLSCEQAPPVPMIDWTYAWGDANDDWPVGAGRDLDVATDFNGNIYVAASAGTDLTIEGVPYSFARFGGVVFGLDPFGTFLWATDFTSDLAGGDLVPRRIKVDPVSGDIIVTGSGFGGNAMVGGLMIGGLNGNCSGFVVKLSPFDGTVVWGNTLEPTNAANCNSIAGADVDDFGDVWVAGSFNASLTSGLDTLTSQGGVDAFLAHFDFFGAPLALHHIASGDADEAPEGLAVLADGNIAVVGYSNVGTVVSLGPPGGATNYARGGSLDSFYATFDPAGTLLGSGVINTADNESLLHVARSHNSSDYYVSGTGGVPFGGTNGGLTLARVTQSGSIVWSTGTSEGSPHGLRRFVVDGAERVRFAINQGSSQGLPFAGITVPVGPNQHIYSVDGVTGAGIHISAHTPTMGMDFKGFALQSPGAGVVVGYHDNSGTLDGVPVAGFGSRDQFIAHVLFDGPDYVVVTNPGFEFPDLGGDGSGVSDDVRGWQTEGSIAGVHDPSPADNVIPADGDQVAFLNGGSFLHQALSIVFVEGYRYTVTGVIYERAAHAPIALDLGIGGVYTPLPTPLPGAGQPFQVDLDIGPGDPLAGGNVFLDIQTVGPGTQTLVDGIQVSVTPIPF